MGLRALYNGIVKFTNVRVPRENMLAKEGTGTARRADDFEHRPPDAAGGVCRFAKRCSRFRRKWANERVQWGAPIGKHAPSPTRSRAWRPTLLRWKR